ncbi:MAG: hypothetical protein V4450_14360 [Bacteroidota bacterium]
MARANNIFNFKGKLGELSFYQHKDYGKIVRRKGGPSAEQIAEAQQFVEVRANNSEFAYCSQLSGNIRKAFHEICHSSGDSSLHGRLCGQLKLALKADTDSAPGQRQLTTGALVKQLTNFPMRKGNGFTNELIIDISRDTEALHIHWRVDPAYLYNMALLKADRLVLQSYVACFNLADNATTYQLSEPNIAHFSLDAFKETSGNFTHAFEPYRYSLVLAAMQVSCELETNQRWYPMQAKNTKKSGFVYVNLVDQEF